MLHPPRTGGTWLVEAWRLEGTPEYQGHSIPTMPHPFGVPDLTYCTVRNPFDRVVSIWAIQWAQLIGFREWVLEGFRAPGIERATYIDRMPVLAPCWEWAQHADFIVQHEFRRTDVGRLAELLDRPVPADFAPVNTSDRDDYRTYYDTSTVEIVSRVFAMDLEELGYGFDG